MAGSRAPRKYNFGGVEHTGATGAGGRAYTMRTTRDGRTTFSPIDTARQNDAAMRKVARLVPTPKQPRNNGELWS